MQYTTVPDDSLRNAILFAVGNWAQDDAQLEPVTVALESSEGQDRVATAMSLANSAVTTPVQRDALPRRVADDAEIWEVRRIAADTLQERSELDFDHHGIIAAFRVEQARIAREQWSWLSPSAPRPQSDHLSIHLNIFALSCPVNPLSGQYFCPSLSEFELV